MCQAKNEVLVHADSRNLDKSIESAPLNMRTNSLPTKLNTESTDDDDQPYYIKMIPTVLDDVNGQANTLRKQFGLSRSVDNMKAKAKASRNKTKIDTDPIQLSKLAKINRNSFAEALVHSHTQNVKLQQQDF